MLESYRDLHFSDLSYIDYRNIKIKCESTFTDKIDMILQTEYHSPVLRKKHVTLYTPHWYFYWNPLYPITALQCFISESEIS